MIDCEYCGGRHRDAKTIDTCKAKADRAAARLAKIEAETLRRQRIQDKIPVEKFVRKARAAGGAGGTWERVASSLNKDYPVRTARPYTVYEVVEIYAETLNWPIPKDRTVQMLLEKHYVGEYLTDHPLLYVTWPDGVRTPEQLKKAVELQEEVLSEGDF